MNESYAKIKEKIISDDKTANVVEYMLSKAISNGIPTTVKFIYKKHKIIKTKNRLYSIYKLDTGEKLYSKIKYQDMAKYIIDNLGDESKIRRIFELEESVSRLKDKIDFLKLQYKTFKNKEIIEDKIQSAYDLYNSYKKEFLRVIGKNNIC